LEMVAGQQLAAYIRRLHLISQLLSLY
jgi:hypothetical protein